MTGKNMTPTETTTVAASPSGEFVSYEYNSDAGHNIVFKVYMESESF
jgi:hypothetical protein